MCPRPIRRGSAAPAVSGRPPSVGRRTRRRTGMPRRRTRAGSRAPRDDDRSTVDEEAGASPAQDGVSGRADGRRAAVAVARLMRRPPSGAGRERSGRAHRSVRSGRPPVPPRREDDRPSTSEPRIITGPSRAASGSTQRCAVPTSARAMCGTASPVKAIGPTAATEAPVSTVAPSAPSSRSRPTLCPRPLAASSPSASASRPRDIATTSTRPVSRKGQIWPMMSVPRPLIEPTCQKRNSSNARALVVAIPDTSEARKAFIAAPARASLSGRPHRALRWRRRTRPPPPAPRP